MEQPVALARHFAYLVSLLLREPERVDEQKTALRAMLGESKQGVVHIALHAETLQANEHPVPAAFPGVADLASQMAMHGLALITIDANASAPDLLGVARIMASMAVRGDGGAAAEARRLEMKANTVRFAARPAFSNEAAPIPEMEFGEVFDDPFAEAMSKATPRSSRAIDTTKSTEGTGGLFSQFAAPREPTLPWAELLAQLDAAVDSSRVASLLDDLTVIAERAAKDDQPSTVAEILYRVVRREPEQEMFENKQLFAMALRRLFRTNELRAVAQALPKDPERRTSLMAILVRAGDDGAESLIEQLADPGQQRDRRVYIDALAELKAGIPALLHMLSDDRWFAVRNAAELLGEMRVKEAESALVELMHHDDERVRRAANQSLLQLGASQGFDAAQKALHNPSPLIRIEAAAVLAAARDSKAVRMLATALDDEKDASVQAALMLSLGKHASNEAVQRLIRAAEPERSMFRRKSVELRVSAIRGLSEARTPEAIEALRSLQDDKDEAIRDAAAQGLRRVSRKTIAVQQPPL